jgi:hypothetical protein
MKSYPIVAAALLLAAARPDATPFTPPASATCTAGYAVPQRPYVALRRLEAANSKSGKEAWLDARTSLGSDGQLAVEILDEGGSEQIRNRVLRAALEREQELVASRFGAQGSTPAETYECVEPELDPSGLLRVPLRPRKKDVNLVYGDLFMQPSTGDVVRVAGRLAKSPSFWVSQVDVEWRYERVHNDVVLPVSLLSNAKVKIFGPSTFRMTYDYVSVDGHAVSTATRASR